MVFTRYLVKAMSARFLHGKVVFPSAVNILERRDFDTMQIIPLLHKSFSLILASILPTVFRGSNGDFLFTSFLLYLLIRVCVEKLLKLISFF